LPSADRLNLYHFVSTFSISSDDRGVILQSPAGADLPQGKGEEEGNAQGRREEDEKDSVLACRGVGIPRPSARRRCLRQVGPLKYSPTRATLRDFVIVSPFSAVSQCPRSS